MPRILYFDVETAPYLADVWAKWVDGPVMAIERDWNLLSVAWNWDGEKRILGESLRGKDPHDDRPLLDTLHDLFSEADWVIAHNGNGFDIPKVQARFLLEGYSPPAPFGSVDTLQICRRHFKGGLRSNKLTEICQQLGIGKKTPHTGAQLWLDCLASDDKAWGLMERYNKQDIVLLRGLYLHTRGWATSHPAFHLTGCPTCGSGHIQSRGTTRRQQLTYPQLQCMTCTGWFLGVKSVPDAPKPAFKSAVRR